MWLPRHVGVAAEAIAAAQFARLSFDVSVQYGANQPEYDLIVARNDKLLKVSVKGSQEGGWGLNQNEKKNATYHEAADKWFAKHKPGTVLCLVQFYEVPFDELPRVYLAHPYEIAKKLKEASGGRGDTILHENKTRGLRAFGAGTVDRVPEDWRLSEARVLELMANMHTDKI